MHYVWFYCKALSLAFRRFLISSVEMLSCFILIFIWAFDGVFLLSNGSSRSSEVFSLSHRFFHYRGLTVHNSAFDVTLMFNELNADEISFHVSPYSTVLFYLANSVKVHYKSKLKLLVKISHNSSIFSLINVLNKEVDSFVNSFSFLPNYGFLSKELDYYLYKLLWGLMKRRHPRRSRTWVFNKFWKFFSRRLEILLFWHFWIKINFLKLSFFRN